MNFVLISFIFSDVCVGGDSDGGDGDGNGRDGAVTVVEGWELVETM